MKRPVRIGLLVAAAALLSGCQMPSLQDLAGIGGGLGGPTKDIDVVFTDALNVPRQAEVKMDGAKIGEVSGVRTKDYKAIVTLRVLETAKIPEGSRAEIRMSSPIGDVFIALFPPKDAGGRKLLADGATIPLPDSVRNATPEDVLTTMGNFVNGSSLQDLQVLIGESEGMMYDQIVQLRAMFDRLDLLVRTLNDGSGDLGQVITDTMKLTTQMAGVGTLIQAALDEGAPVIEAFGDNTDEFTRLLAAARSLAVIGERVITLSQDAFISDLSNIAPVLEEILKADQDIGPLLRELTRFGDTAKKYIPGDYVNFSFELPPLQQLIPHTINEELQHPLDLTRFIPRPFAIPDLPGPLGALSEYLTDPLGDVLPMCCEPGPPGVTSSPVPEDWFQEK